MKLTQMVDPLVFVAAAMPPPLHGQSAVTAHVVRALTAASCRTVLADTSPGSLRRTIEYHARRSIKVGDAVFSAMTLWSYPSKRLYTVVESGFGIFYNFLIVATTRAFGFRIFLHHHTGKYCKQRSLMVRWLFAIAGCKATHIVLSHQMANDLWRLYPTHPRVQIVHNARYVEPVMQRAKPTPKTLRLGLLSNLCAEKGLDLAIETCMAAVAAGLDVELVLAGPLANSAGELSLDRARKQLQAFEYRGSLTEKAKCTFFNDIDIFLFPTLYRYEAQPLVVIEAMAAGVPVIANDRGYIAELLSGCGILVRDGDDYVAAALQALNKWYLDREALRRSGEQCRQCFARYREIAERQFLDVLHEMIRC
jgi:glycosyltransferase involved in cell wall biosynthesis